ncbi:putative major facilitator superfamily transporter protein [Botryosphaeria dothidea]|uniref:Major facilitator superfamily transporter protein n=1 Tax=Botryosphaeria dothidea TaxID=55169 RepID=A0A8H4IKP0_9PEZI|nr:putative major facilitator superfamily transporter protein [Botryosphaeria dothidea]
MGVFNFKAAPGAERPSIFHWHEPGTSKEEKWLIRKLDIFILTYSCLCFFIKYLDQTNISNAYVSGMKEELGLYGNELNLMTTYYNIGYIIGAPLSNLLLTVILPRIHLPACLLTWSVFVLALFRAQNAVQIYILRFFIGFFESAALPGLHYVIGSWYRRSELGRRSAFFVISGVLGQMFSGYLQSGLYTGMNGRGGLSAWRWLFVFDFVLAVPVVLYGATCFPDTPKSSTAWWLNGWEKRRARERMEEEGRAEAGKMDWSAVRRIFGSWQLYVFCVAWSLWSLTCGSSVQTWMALWLKSEKTADGKNRYSVPEINNIPTVVGAVNFFFMTGSGIASDIIGSRAPVMFVVGILMTFCYVIYVIWPSSTGLKMAAFFLQGCYGCFSPLLSGWVNSLCGGDNQLRAFTMAMMMSVGSAFSTPFSQYMFPANDAPTYRKTHGYIAALVFVVALTLWCSVVLGGIERWYYKRQVQSVAEENGSEEASVEETEVQQKSSAREAVSEVS